MKPLDTANTFRKYAVLDSDAEVYELAVRLFFPKESNGAQPFTDLMLRDKVIQMTGYGWYWATGGMRYGIRLLLNAQIIAPHQKGFVTTAPRNDARVARLLKYQYKKIEELEKQFREMYLSTKKK